MKITMIGTGAMGQVCAAQLARAPDVEELRLCDIRVEVAERTAEYLKRQFAFDRSTVHKTDASALDELLRVCDGVDVVVNMGSPSYNLKIGKAALECQAHYVDIGLDTPEEWHYPRELEDPEIGEVWRDAGLTALKSIGLSPGITDMLGKYTADRLDTVHDLFIRGFSDVEMEGDVPFWSAYQFTLDQLTVPRAMIDGTVQEVPWGGAEETYAFPNLAETFPHLSTNEWLVSYISHPEANYLSRTIGKGLRNCDIKWSVQDYAESTVLRERGLLSQKPITVKGVEVAPVDILLALSPPTLFIDDYQREIDGGSLCDYLFFVVDALGESDGKKERHVRWFHMTARQASEIVPGATATAYTTATPPAIAAILLGRDEIKSCGVFIPEMLPKGEIDLMFNKLAEVGIVILERVERIIQP
jgi:saccharopine dehydrogenase-like NADP-dependent oxidoreductase